MLYGIISEMPLEMRYIFLSVIELDMLVGATFIVILRHADNDRGWPNKR